MSAATRYLSTHAGSPALRDYGNNLTDDFGTIPDPSPAEVAAARLTVCGRAESVDEARELLGMLGLIEVEHKPVHDHWAKPRRVRRRRS